MEKGDISNDMPRRVLVLWERGLGILNPSSAKAYQERLFLKVGLQAQAVACWEINEHMIDRLWDLWRRYDLRCDVVVTDHSKGFSKALEKRLEENDSPTRRVLTIPLEQLGRRLIRMPDVIAVLHHDSRLLWAFGTKGHFVEFGEPLYI